MHSLAHGTAPRYISYPSSSSPRDSPGVRSCILSCTKEGCRCGKLSFLPLYSLKDIPTLAPVTLYCNGGCICLSPSVYNNHAEDICYLWMKIIEGKSNLCRLLAPKPEVGKSCHLSNTCTDNLMRVLYGNPM